MDSLYIYSEGSRIRSKISMLSFSPSAVTALASAAILTFVSTTCANADRGFFADGVAPYWQQSPSLSGGRTRARVEVTAERQRTPARRTAAVRTTSAVDDDDDDDGMRPQTRRTAPARPSLKRPPVVRQKSTTKKQTAGGRPRLTPAQSPAPKAARASRTRVASLGAPATFGPSAPSSMPSLSGGLVAWRARASCLASNLRNVIERVASYGHVTVNSTCRNRAHNRRVGGATRSWHLTGNAADIRIRGNWRAASAFLRSSVGGFSHYGGGLFHIDNGPKRTF